MTGLGPAAEMGARALAAAVALGLASTACGSSSDGGTATVGTASTAESSSPTSESGTASTGTAGSGSQGSSSPGSGGAAPSTTGTTSAPAAQSGLAVGPDGLQFLDGARSTLLPFGSGRDEVVTALEAVLGTSPTATPSSPECGNQADEQLRWPGQLAIDIRDDQMISWQLDRGSPLTTVSGAGLGSTRAEVESAIVIQVDETSLGTELATEGSGEGGGMGGLLTGPEDNATVTELWAGEICAFR
ncbi:MAG: hypothetical protein OEW29_05235 [Acidimicrobiia bacterium]|nr:hypothetical protein [Acidimicrobiia bacterium]MDH4363482.1 hypothetical protein [Acidimicrobiia bacterium]